MNHFLTVVNYRYSAIYGPTLTQQYVQWWADRAVGKGLSPEFTCLLLRICAYSVQYLTPSLRKMIEFELACSSQALTERFASAAEQLSQSFEASNTSIERVQEQFLKGAWLKSESKIVESWHALGCTIREAQELGTMLGLRGLCCTILTLFKGSIRMLESKECQNLTLRFEDEYGRFYISGTGKPMRTLSEAFELMNN